ncbi:MAG TPA: SCO family protein [Terriglobales bacterium]|nr:SCO family protein [Terriglobales bacterium]
MCVAVLACSICATAQQDSSAASATIPSDAYQRQDQRPRILQQVGIDQHLNQQLPLNLQFEDEYGKDVKLGDYFGSKPVILSLVYYRCPMLCTQVLSGIASALNVLTFDAGKEFNVVTVSIDPRETPDIAFKTKQVYMQRYQRPTASQGWHFLTGREDQIEQLAKAVGFRYVYDPKIQQYAHASGIQIVTPDGRMSQYYYGIDYSPRDLRLGLIQASKNHIGTVVDAVVLYCYHYDPETGHYGAITMRILRLSAIVTVLVLGGFIFTMARRDVRAKKASA